MKIQGLSGGGICGTIGVVTLIIFALLGVDVKLIANQVNISRMKARYETTSQQGAGNEKSLLNKMPASLYGQCLIAPRQSVIPIMEESEVANPEVAPNILRLSGVFVDTKGRKIAVINGDLMRVGDIVEGHKLSQIHQKYVVMEYAGKATQLYLNQSYSFIENHSELYKLSKIAPRGAVLIATINGRECRVGEWVDEKTLVRAVTPTYVVIQREGEEFELTFAP